MEKNKFEITNSDEYVRKGLEEEIRGCREYAKHLEDKNKILQQEIKQCNEYIKLIEIRNKILDDKISQIKEEIKKSIIEVLDKKWKY